MILLQFVVETSIYEEPMSREVNSMHGNSMKNNYPTSSMIEHREEIPSDTTRQDTPKPSNESYSIADNEVSSSGRSHQTRQIAVPHGNSEG